MSTYSFQNGDKGVSVHDGFPNPATDSSLQPLDFNNLLIWHSASTFMMSVVGDQWEDRGVFDGDIAVIDRALKPRAIDLVVWQKEADFAVSYHRDVPEDSEIWGVLTAIVHIYRKKAA